MFKKLSCPEMFLKWKLDSLKLISIYLNAMNISLDEEIQKDKDTNKQNRSHGYSHKVDWRWFRYLNLDKWQSNHQHHHYRDGRRVIIDDII